MSLLKYEIVNVVIKLGSVTKAAAALNLTQSAVSHAIASLEAELGFLLLSRSRSGIRLTSEGEQIIASIRQVLAQNEIVRQQAALIKGLKIGTVTIGTFSSISRQWLPEIIKSFKRSHPAVEVKLQEGTYEDISAWIANGSVDFGFMSALTAKVFDFIPLKKDPMACIIPSDHILHTQALIRFEQVKEETWIMPKWGENDDIRQCLKANIASPRIEYEAAEPATVVSMVEHGLGISILPQMVLNSHQPNRKICIIELEKSYFRLIGLAAPSFKNLSPAAMAFIDCIKSWLKAAQESASSCK